MGDGERVVHGVPALRLLVELEHREVDHPQRLPLAFDQAVRLAELAVADLHAQRADGVVDDLGLVGAEEDQVAVWRAGALRGSRRARASCRFFTIGDCRPSRPVADVVDLDPGQALGAVDLDELGVAVDLAAAHLAAAGHAQRRPRGRPARWRRRRTP